MENFDYIVKTTIIICHLYFFYNFVLDDSGMSSKQKKALQFLEKKHDIEILSESEILNRI